MDIRATYRRARGRVGWVWVCYSHPTPIRRFYLAMPRRLGWIPAERRCCQGLHAHLYVNHPESLDS